MARRKTFILDEEERKARQHKIDLFERVLCGLLSGGDWRQKVVADAVALTNAALKAEEEMK
jgi:hypothetical protein